MSAVDDSAARRTVNTATPAEVDPKSYASILTQACRIAITKGNIAEQHFLYCSAPSNLFIIAYVI
jgi:S-adenosylmethionine:diacylglycerol 3-amino-3-carboxypropyl transferase